jgi:16S rRNA (guanine(527)-N(7))-methyltransferase RsmG
MPAVIESFRQALRRHAPDFGIPLKESEIERLGGYYRLLLKWNPRLHLVAPCSPEDFATRHVLESLLLLLHLPQAARVIDVGSGGGLPIIPCLTMRPDLRVTLIESSQKKAVFLREALRQFSKPEPPCLLVTRFEDIPAPAADFLTCRALDRFQEVLPGLIDWAPPLSTLLLFGGPALVKMIEGLIPSVRAELIAGSEQRFLIIARQGDA